MEIQEFCTPNEIQRKPTAANCIITFKNTYFALCEMVVMMTHQAKIVRSDAVDRVFFSI